MWSVLSLVLLLGGTGVLFAVYGRWSQMIGWHGAKGKAVTFRQPGEVALTPSQRTVGWFFLVVSLLFLVQTLVGAAAEHYRADLTSFFGFDLAKILPYNLARTWYLQLSLFWTAAAFLAAAIFLVPFISGRRQPRGQHVLAYGLLGALVVVVLGSLTSEVLSIFGVSWVRGSSLLSQQWEYLDLPRLWQILLVIGLAWMVFASLLPLGLLQLFHSVNDGYFEARSLGYITSPGNALLEWMRLPGDLVFIGGGALPFIWICWLGVRYRATKVTDIQDEDALFSDKAIQGAGSGTGAGDR